MVVRFRENHWAHRSQNHPLHLLWTNSAICFSMEGGQHAKSFPPRGMSRASKCSWPYRGDCERIYFKRAKSWHCHSRFQDSISRSAGDSIKILNFRLPIGFQIINLWCPWWCPESAYIDFMILVRLRPDKRAIIKLAMTTAIASKHNGAEEPRLQWWVLLHGEVAQNQR